MESERISNTTNQFNNEYEPWKMNEFQTLQTSLTMRMSHGK